MTDKCSVASLLFPGPGEMAKLCRNLDWSGTQLGPVDQWPQSLRTAAQMVLAAPFPNIILWGRDLLQIYNDGYREIMGKKHPKGLGQRTEECWPEVWHINQPIYERVWTGESFSFEDALYPLARYGGLEDVWFTLSYSPVRDESGAVAGILVNVFDNSSRVLAERQRAQIQQALQESEERNSFSLQLSDIIRSLDNPMDIQDKAVQLLGRQLNAGRAFYYEAEPYEDAFIHKIKRTYYSPNMPDLIGSYTHELFGKDLLKQLAQGEMLVVDDVNKVAGLTPDQLQNYHNLGIRAFIIMPLIRENRYVAGISVQYAEPRHWTASEITKVHITAERTWAALQHIKAEIALRHSQEQLRQSILLAGLGICDWDYASGSMTCNEQRLQILGLPAGEQCYDIAAIKKIMHPDERESVWQDIIGQIEKLGAFTADYRIIHKATGAIRWLKEIGKVVAYEQGQPKRLSTVLMDVTAYEQAQLDLRIADQRKDDFLAMLAHELRNPMSTIHTGVQLLLYTSGSAETVRNTAIMMKRQTEHLVRLVDDLLDQGRIRNGKIVLQMKSIALGSLLEHTAVSVQALFRERRHQLQLNLSHHDILVKGDEVRLTQIVSNLLVNAARYTPDGGYITLSLRREAEEAVIEVSDNGIGLTADQRVAIFELFFQVDNSLARSQSGLGLGLTLVKQLTRMHGGRVTATSPGLHKGSTFTVYLPLLSANAAALQDEGELVQTDAPSGMPILVIDDNRDAATLLKKILRIKGYHAHSRHSGKEGLAAALELQPEVILLDIGMPDMDGYETCRMLREQRPGYDPLIIALSGYALSDYQLQINNTRFDAQLLKPIDLKTLLETIGRLLNTR